MADQTWTSSVPASLDPVNKLVTFETNHFSDWSMVHQANGMKLRIRGTFNEKIPIVGLSVYFEVSDSVSLWHWTIALR